MKIKMFNLSLSCAKHTHVSPVQMLPQASYLQENDFPDVGNVIRWIWVEKESTYMMGFFVVVHD